MRFQISNLDIGEITITENIKGIAGQFLLPYGHISVKQCAPVSFLKKHLPFPFSYPKNLFPFVSNPFFVEGLVLNTYRYQTLQRPQVTNLVLSLA